MAACRMTEGFVSTWREIIRTILIKEALCRLRSRMLPVQWAGI
jgi:hypothetical protein